VSHLRLDCLESWLSIYICSKYSLFRNFKMYYSTDFLVCVSIAPRNNVCGAHEFSLNFLNSFREFSMKLGIFSETFCEITHFSPWIRLVPISQLLHGWRVGSQQQLCHSMACSSKCRECHVTNWYKKLNTDLLLLLTCIIATKQLLWPFFGWQLFMSSSPIVACTTTSA